MDLLVLNMATTDEKDSGFEPQICLFVVEFASPPLGRCFVPKTCRSTGDSNMSAGVNVNMTLRLGAVVKTECTCGHVTAAALVSAHGLCARVRARLFVCVCACVCACAGVCARVRACVCLDWLILIICVGGLKQCPAAGGGGGGGRPMSEQVFVL